MIEKTTAGGGNCRHSGGFLFSVDGPRAIDHLDALCFGKTDRAVLAAYAEGAREVTNFLESLGGRTPVCDPGAFGGLLPSWPHCPGAGHVTTGTSPATAHPQSRCGSWWKRRSSPRGSTSCTRPRSLAAGWIASGSDARELATAVGVDAGTLSQTLDEYHAAVAAGRDDQFNRPPETLAPLTGQLYAVEVVPGLATASGGPRRDARARVLRPDGTAIGGLYAAGAAGSIWGHLTEHGGGLTTRSCSVRSRAARRLTGRAGSTARVW